jgi:hypothetical protein
MFEASFSIRRQQGMLERAFGLIDRQAHRLNLFRFNPPVRVFTEERHRPHNRGGRQIRQAMKMSCPISLVKHLASSWPELT